jgi:hypothetical protein
VVISLQVHLKYCHSVAKVFELCGNATVSIWRHKVTVLVEHLDNKVTEERAGPKCHFLIFFLADKQRPQELMEAVNNFGTLEHLGFEEKLCGHLLYGGKRDVIDRWMLVESLKGNQEELFNNPSIFCRTVIASQGLPVVMNTERQMEVRMHCEAQNVYGMHAH